MGTQEFEQKCLGDDVADVVMINVCVAKGAVVGHNDVGDVVSQALLLAHRKNVKLNT